MVSLLRIRKERRLSRSSVDEEQREVGMQSVDERPYWYSLPIIYCLRSLVHVQIFIPIFVNSKSKSSFIARIMCCTRFPYFLMLGSCYKSGCQKSGYTLDVVFHLPVRSGYL